MEVVGRRGGEAHCANRVGRFLNRGSGDLKGAYGAESII